MAIRASGAPETWAQTRQRTDAFVVMVVAGMCSLPPPKDDPDGEERY